MDIWILVVPKIETKINDCPTNKERVVKKIYFIAKNIATRGYKVHKGGGSYKQSLVSFFSTYNVMNVLYIFY